MLSLILSPLLLLVTELLQLRNKGVFNFNGASLGDEFSNMYIAFIEPYICVMLGSDSPLSLSKEPFHAPFFCVAV